MKTDLFKSLFFILISVPLLAQEPVVKVQSVPVAEKDIIILDGLQGEVFLKNSSDNQIHLKTTFHPKTGGIGVSIMPVTYDVGSQKSGNTITFKPEKPEESTFITFQFSDDGITKNEIEIPENVIVIIKSTETDIDVSGKFILLDISNRNGKTKLKIDKTDFQIVELFSRNGNIDVNGNRKSEQFYHNLSVGKSICSATSNTGDINLILF